MQCSVLPRTPVSTAITEESGIKEPLRVNNRDDPDYKMIRVIPPDIRCLSASSKI
jgi:hypothetical protein